MIPVDTEIIQLIAVHLTTIRQGLEEGFLSVTLEDDDLETDPMRLRDLLIETESYLINALEESVTLVLQDMLPTEGERPLPTKDNVIMFPVETIEA